jgi:hypothetical protein
VKEVNSMEKKSYSTPKVAVLGTVKDLTRGNEWGGSGRRVS